MTLNLPTPGPDDVWGAQLNTALNALNAADANAETPSGAQTKADAARDAAVTTAAADATSKVQTEAAARTAALADKLNADTASTVYATRRLARRPGRGIVCLSWDDGWAEQQTIADMATARGQRHTFYVNGSLIGTAGRLTIGQLQGLEADGHEIGWHSNTHVDMTSLTPAGRAPEWDASALQAQVSGPVTAYAYPFGFRNATTDVEAYGRFGSIVGLTAGLTGPSVYQLDDVMPFVHYRYDWGASADTLATVTDLVRLVARQPVAVHIYAHRPDVAANPSTAQITSLLDLIQDLDVPAMGVTDVFGSAGRVINPFFESGLNGWVPQVGTGGTVDVVDDTPMDGLLGDKSVQLTVPTGAAFAYVRQYVPVTPGRSYVLSGRVRSVGGTAVQMRLGLRDINGSVTGTNTGTAYTATTWGAATATLTATALSRWAVLDCLAQTTAGQGFIDRVDFGETALGTYA